MNYLNNFHQACSQLENRLEWSDYFMSIAILASSRSPCNRLKVGCVIVRDNRILSTAYNGFLPGKAHESIIVNNHEQATIHAEQNAICHAARNGININNSQAYITHYPCVNCYKSLVAAGITDIFYFQDYKNDPIVNNLNNDTKISLTKISDLHTPNVISKKINKFKNNINQNCLCQVKQDLLFSKSKYNNKLRLSTSLPNLKLYSSFKVEN